MFAVVGTTWRRNPRALTRVAPRGILVCLREHDVPLQLEGATAIVFDVLANNATTADLIGGIAERIERSPEVIEREVIASVEALAELGLIEAVPGA